MNSKFFTFIHPFLNFIDNGHFFRSPFKWLYMLFGLFFLLSPVYIMYKAVDNNLFDAPAKYVFGFLFAWLVMAFTCWLCFQVWWERKDKIAMYSKPGDEFVATPVFSHFIQTLGETYGIVVGIVGFTVVLLGLLSDNYELRSMIYSIFPYGREYSGATGLLIMPIAGFMIVVIFRFLAELVRSLSAIANNTRAATQSPAAEKAQPDTRNAQAQFDALDY